MLSNVMKPVPIAGTLSSVSFYEDDTIETVRQLIALEVDSHPDRLFIECNTTLPADYYSGNPKHWMELFFRLSYDGLAISEQTLKTYVTQIRLGTGFVPKAVTKEEWERRSDLDLLLKSDSAFSEWRILGVPVAASMVLPHPPADVPIRSAQIPIPRPQSLMETLHRQPITEFRTAEIADEMSDTVKRIFFPLVRPDTPSSIESLRTALAKSQKEHGDLLALRPTPHQSSALIKAKWTIPLLSTRFPAPRARFEQILYGMTMTPETPHIGYFTSKVEAVRHKFYVEDPKTKIPKLSIPMFNGWYAKTQPQRRRPTLILYRGRAPAHFDRIAITDTEIAVDVRREKTSKASLDALKTEMREWMDTFDALLPFVDVSDLDVSRWELEELSLIATYGSEITDFDMRRFACLQSIFSVQGDVFRVLRAEQPGGDIPPPLLQAYQALNQDGAPHPPTPEYLAEELSISIEEARERIEAIDSMSEEVNFDRALRAYPTLKFTNKEVILRFVTNPERMLQYADLLRYILTTDSDAVNDVCPRRLEEVAPQVAIPQQEIRDEDADLDLLAALGAEEEPVPEVEQGASNAAPPPKARKVRVSKKVPSTQTYFNDRLKDNFPDTFDQSFFPKKCEKRQQPIVLSTDDQTRISTDPDLGDAYLYTTAPESETLPLETDDGVAICPPYWCIRDEIPLREDQLKMGEDGELHCPIPTCNGKIRKTDTDDRKEFTLIRRDTAMKYPDFMKRESTINKKKIPCCYLQPRSQSKVLSEDLYIFREDVNLDTGIPGFRFAYLSDALAERLHAKTSYATTTKKNYLIFGESDIFRIGLTRPSKTLPELLGKPTTKIPPPSEARDNLLKCSFVRTWRPGPEGTGSQVDRIVASIDTAYREERLTIHQELEYVTSFLGCGVILVDPVSMQVSCGFWSDTLSPDDKTIAVLGNDVLGLVRRKRSGKVYKTEFTVDLRKPPFTDTVFPHLVALRKEACAVGVPTFETAVEELRRAGFAQYTTILDPFQRVQALLIPGKVLLPILPTTKATGTVTPLQDYSNLTDADVPAGDTQRALLENAKHPGYKLARAHQNSSGQIVELEVASGFRIPIQPEDADTPAPASEVLETIRSSNEKVLVDGTPNEDDKTSVSKTMYASELYEFLLFSLSRDIQTEEFAGLRTVIEQRGSTLYRDLKTWFDNSTYTDTTKSPVSFINKVRTPCGQYKAKDACNKSSLCGWHRGDCKIRVKPLVTKEEVLKRMVKTLRDNDKQRALVLDARLSPFFSTVLYLEMPNEVILTSL